MSSSSPFVDARAIRRTTAHRVAPTSRPCERRRATRRAEIRRAPRAPGRRSCRWPRIAGDQRRRIVARPGRRSPATRAAYGIVGRPAAGRTASRRGRGRPSRPRSRPRGSATPSPRASRSAAGLSSRCDDLLRAVGGDLVVAVADRGVAQPLEALLDIGERRRRPAPARASAALSSTQHAADEGGEQRVGHGVEGVLVAGEHAEVGERRLRGVQHPHLEMLERRHVVDEAARRRGPRAARRPAKRSSITHWRNGSPTTDRARRGSRSCRSTAARSAGVVAGTMRSTMRRGEGGVGGDPVARARRRAARPARRTTAGEDRAVARGCCRS